MKTTGRKAKIVMSGGDAGIVCQAGGLLLVETLRATGLDRGWSQALSWWRAPRAVHDPGKIVTDLAIALALSGDCLADVAVLRSSPEVFGPVASDPTVPRLVKTLSDAGPAALRGIRKARAVARERAWELAGGDAPGGGGGRATRVSHGRSGVPRPGRLHPSVDSGPRLIEKPSDIEFTVLSHPRNEDIPFLRCVAQTWAVRLVNAMHLDQTVVSDVDDEGTCRLWGENQGAVNVPGPNLIQEIEPFLYQNEEHRSMGMAFARVPESDGHTIGSSLDAGGGAVAPAADAPTRAGQDGRLLAIFFPGHLISSTMARMYDIDSSRVRLSDARWLNTLRFRRRSFGFSR